MQYSVVAILALAGAAFANPAAVTLTTSTTTLITVTDCAPTVTNCPARTVTQTIPAYVTYPVGHAAVASGNGTGAGALYPTGGAKYCAGGACGTDYHVPTVTGYKGPSFTGAASQMKAGAALAGVGAVAALLL